MTPTEKPANNIVPLLTQAVQHAQTATRARSTTTQPSGTSTPKRESVFEAWLGLKTFGDTELIKLADACGKWCNAIKRSEPAHWLTLLGTCGTGKTHSAKRIWRWACDFYQADSCHAFGRNLKYCPHIVHWPSFVMDLRGGTEYERIADMRRWPFLVIDEIGAERDTTGFASEHLATLLGCRVGKWTLLTSNLTQAQVAEIDTRIVSRIYRDNGKVVIVNTQDFALRRAQ